MVFQINPQIPLAYRGYDYGRSQANALRGLQMQAAEREVDEQNALAQVLRDNGEALTSDDPSVRGTAAAQIARTGMRGYQIAAPVLEAARNEREFAAIRGRFGGGAQVPVAPAGGAIPAAVSGGAANPQWEDRSLPRGIRNNNPLNLSYVPGQPGVQGTDGRFGRYSTPEEGIAAGVRQLQMYGARGLTTTEQIISRWAPPNENNTAAYVATVSRALGVAPNAPIDLNNPEVVSRLVGAMAQMENGRPLDPAVVQRGVTMALQGGRPAPGGAPAAGGDVVPASAQGDAGGGQRMPGMPTPQQFAELVDLAGSPNPRVARWAQAQVQTWAPFMRRDDPERFAETTRNIGGRQVVGQVNQRTGQFTPYPGQGGGADGITPAQARSDVLQLGPRVAAGEIQPGTPEYDRYEMAYRLATQDRFEWVDDPNNPGTQRQVRVPGIQLNPGRFPPPVEGVYGASGASAAPQAGAAPAAPPAPAGAAPAAPAGAPAPAADATSANPTPITRQAPNAQPTGEENLSAGYARRMVEAEALLERAVQGGYTPGNIRDSAAGAIAGGQRAGPVSRFVGNSLMSGGGQLYRQAQEDWVRAKLRRESGAVIGEDEMAREIQVYFPQPGDTPAVIAQKAAARRVAIDAMRQASGRASATVPQAGGGQPRRVATPEEAARLEPGTEYVTPDGSRYIR